MNRSRALAWIVAVAIAAAAFEPFYLRIFTIHRAKFAAALIDLPYRKLPGSRAFLLEVQRRTREGDAIAIYAEMQGPPRWEGGYDYLYARATYLLAGRRVVPLIDPDERPHLEKIATANYIAAYRSQPDVPGFAPLYRGPDGSLLRRTP